MENIRIIKEKIRSCISCDENQCPRIKERLDHHVQSHHSSLKRTFSQQITPTQKYSRILYPSRSNISDLKSDVQTSTSSLLDDKETENVKTSSYKEGLRAIVFEFIKNLRKNQNAKYSNREENIINEFIEKITKPSIDQTDDNYGVYLDTEIDDFLRSVPASIDTQNDYNMASLKENFATKINDFNTNNPDKIKKQNENVNIEERKSILKDKDTTTAIVNNAKSNKKDATVQSSDTGFLINSISGTSEALQRFSSNNLNKLRKRSVDTQFPNVSGTFYANITERTNLKNATDLLTDVNIENNLREQGTYFINRFEKSIGTDEELKEIYGLIHETVNKNLMKYSFDYYSEIITKEIIDFLSGNIHLIHSNNPDLEVKLINIIKSVTDISDIIVDEIVNSIMNTLNNSKVKEILNHYSSTSNRENKHYFGNIISVFKTEQNLSDPCNNTSPPMRKRKSSILKKTTKSNSAEKNYVDKLVALIKAWIDILPKTQNKVNKKLKESLINNLVEDILDQVKLEQVAPETGDEKEKYISFFIYRWLNKHDYFEDINEAKAYVDQLVDKIKEIPLPNLITTQNELQKATDGINMTNDIDMLKMEIMNLFNEQPSKIFLKKDKSGRNEMIQKFVLKMHETINKCLPENLNDEIKERLLEIVKPESKQNIISLAETLEGVIKKFMKTENKNNNHRQKQIEGNKKYSSCCGALSESFVPEDTIQQLFEIYLEHKYNCENFIARKACAELFKNELNKLNSHFKVENNTCPRLQKQQAKTLEKLSNELQYIKIITDWIKELPLKESLNKTQNTVEAELVISIAKNIQDIDEKSSSEDEYKKNLNTIINKFAEKLPITTPLKNNMQEKINVLTRKIAAVKYESPVDCCSINNSLPDKDLTDYIERYIRDNDEEIFDDDLKLESCILRLFREITHKTNTNVSDNDASVSNKFTDTSLTHNDAIKNFSLEMDYAKEISDWLKNLPLLSFTDKATQNHLVTLINDLAEKVSKTENDSEIKDYITAWISKLPLDPNKEIVMPVVIQQILNRIKRINKGHAQKEDKIATATQKLENAKSTGNVCEYPHSCCNKTITCEDNRDPATVIIEYIEEWCNDLPIQVENETIARTLKENVASKLFQKFGELNMIPEYFKNNILYEEMFSEEIDSQLKNLPNNPTLQNLKKELKKRLLDVIIEQRHKIKTKISGVEYKHELEKTIEISMPNIVPNYKEESPGFKIYKDRLATIFILENFDHGNDAVKLNYERRIRAQINKYYGEIQDNNSGPLTKDQLNNELYNLLFSVPLPNESSMIDEVEEIKTRCEIDSWFETLPLREASDLGELLEWNQILALLAKRLHEFEKYEKDSDTKIHKEITKWLARLPILSKHTNDIDKYANDLQQRLKTSRADRRHVPQRINKSQQSFIDHDTSMFHSSVTVEPRSSQVTLPISLPTCCQTSHQKPKKPTDMILDVVETWCQQLPLPANTQQEKDNTKIIKDNLMIKIIMKISEINMNPEIFNDDFLYDALFDDELENLMSKLPASCDFIQSKNARKHQLKEAIKSIKPLIEEDKARYDYKIEIKNAVDKIVKDPSETDTQKKIYFNSLKEDIVDSIIIYNFNKDDKENSLKYKMLVHDAVDNYYTLIDEDENISRHTRRDSLLKGNQLLCEIDKVPTPGENAILEEVQEIKIKFQLTKFLNDNFVIEDKEKLVLKNQIRTTLAKQLYYSIAAGDIILNKNKIKEDITRTLKKLDENIDFQKVDSFLNQIHFFLANGGHNSELTYDNAKKQNITIRSGKANKVKETDNSKEKHKNEQWLSLLPVTPPSKTHDNSYEYDDSENVRKNSDSVNTREHKKDFDHSFNESGITYERFKKGTLFSSSVVRHHDEQEKINSCQQPTKVTSKTTTNQNISFHPYSANETDDASFNQNQTYNPRAQYKNLENRSSAPTESDHAEKNNITQSSHKGFKPLELNQIHQNVDQDSTDQSNQTQYSQQREPQLDFTIPTPYPRETKPLHIAKDEQQCQQETSSTLLETPILPQVSGFEQYNQTAQTTANQFPVNTQDACTQVTEHSYTPSMQSIPIEPIPFQNFREPRPFIPTTSTARGRMSQGRISHQKAMIRPCNRGQPCRRPSITIFSPTGLPRCNEFDEIPPRSNIKIPEEDSEVCECLNKNKRQKICSAHMRRQCRICNETNPFCRLPPYRYPSFYYHRF